MDDALPFIANILLAQAFSLLGIIVVLLFTQVCSSPGMSGQRLVQLLHWVVTFSLGILNWKTLSKASHHFDLCPLAAMTSRLGSLAVDVCAAAPTLGSSLPLHSGQSIILWTSKVESAQVVERKPWRLLQPCEVREVLD